MNTKGITIEHYGHLNKSEHLVSLVSNIVPGTLVLEAPEPFQGSLSYYSETPNFTPPLYVYLVLANVPGLDEVVLATEAVQEAFPWEFNAAFATVEINFEKFAAIRVRHLFSADQIQALQLAYMRQNIQMKKSSHTFKGRAYLTVSKLFQLTRFENETYLDNDEKDHAYFVIPERLLEYEFEALVHRVKNNTYLLNYDFAQAFFYTNNRIVRVIRVYYPEMTPAIIADVKEAVLKQMRRTASGVV